MLRKKLIVSDLRDLARGSKGAILTDYRGLTVAEVTRLRTKLRESDAEYHIVKNTLYKVALGRDTVSPELEKLLTGPTAILFAKNDVVAPTKAILDFFARTEKSRTSKSKAATLTAKSTMWIRSRRCPKLPPREQIIATLIGTLDGPAANFVGTLDNIIGSFVRTIQAIADKVAESGPLTASAAPTAAGTAELAAPEASAAPTAEALPEPTAETPAAPMADASAELAVEASPAPAAEAALESGTAAAPEPAVAAEAPAEGAETAQLDNAPVETAAEPTAEPAATAERDAAPVEAAVEDAEKTSE